jgi:protein gp37
MGANTNIDWTDSTWNPIRGCSPISTGCKNCCATPIAVRFSGPGGPFEGLVRINAAGSRTAEWNGVVKLIDKHLADPLRWRPAIDHTEWCDREWAAAVANWERVGGERPRREYGCDCPERPRRILTVLTGDPFHDAVTDEMLDRIFAVILLTPQHVHQVLTKRPARALEYSRSGRIQKLIVELLDLQRKGGIADKLTFRALDRMQRDGVPNMDFPPRNVIIGASVEDQENADRRRDSMRALYGMGWRTFVNHGPAVGGVDWRGWEFLEWLAAEGESGQKARPCHPDWIRADRDFATKHSIPFYFKQWGEWLPTNQATEKQRGFRYSAHGLLSLDGSASIIPGLDRQDPEFGLYTRDLDGNDWAAAVYRMGKEFAGALLDGREWREMPEARAAGVQYG